MGTYTELVIKCGIRRDIKQIDKDVLEYLFNDGDEPKHLPDHEFFTKDRWDMVGRCNSYYHIPRTLSFFGEGYLFSRSDMKNYGSEIESFIDWISPLITGEKGRFIGWTWHEESEEPTLIYKGGKVE